MAEYDCIEREAAIEACCGGCNPAMCSSDCDELARIRAIPAADVAPVRHGRWTKEHLLNSYGEWCVCSACGKYWIIDGDQYDFRYCPNCGAKMEVEE